MSQSCFHKQYLYIAIYDDGSIIQCLFVDKKALHNIFFNYFFCECSNLLGGYLIVPNENVIP